MKMGKNEYHAFPMTNEFKNVSEIRKFRFENSVK